MPAVYLVAGVIFARAAYSRSAKFQRQYGTGPWGAGPMLWGFVGLMLGLIGYAFLAIAEKSTKKSLSKRGATAPPAYMQASYPPGGRYASAPAPAAGQWAPPPPPNLPGPPRPNVGGSDFLPGRN